LRDSADKVFKAWYSDEGFTNENIRRGVTFPLYRSHYACSEDGIHWIKPKLGIYREGGQDTNIYWGDDRTGAAEVRDVMIDPFEADESKRFKSICWQAPVHNAAGQYDHQNSYYEVFHSADGVHWKAYTNRPSFGKLGPHLNDVIIWNCNRDSRSYILNTRHLDMSVPALNRRLPRTRSVFRPYYPRDFAKMNKRRIYQCESSDLIHWTEPSLILAPDGEDNLDEHLYGMAQYRVGDTWIGFLNTLHQVRDTIDVQLAYSLDGRNWKRIRKPWFTAGAPGAWDQIMVEIANEPLETGDELWFYYGASGRGHHDWYINGFEEGLDVPEARDVSKVGFFLGMAKLRLDGFCSLTAGPVREGILITRHLASTGTGIVMNAECSRGGYIDVEVFNHNDEIIPGYARKDFDRCTGTSVRHQLSWRSRTKVPPEGFRRLVFYMRNARLYSLQFSV
jgi:hypothetical protein